MKRPPETTPEPSRPQGEAPPARASQTVRPPAASPELREPIRKLEDRLSAHEEQTRKRLSESEERVLHLLEQRLGRLESELAASLREIAEADRANKGAF